MLAPGGPIVTEIACERFPSPRNLARGDDRREGGYAAETVGASQCNGQCSVTAHRVAGDALPLHVDREFRSHERRKLLGHVPPHAVICRVWLLRGVDVESR